MWKDPLQGEPTPYEILNVPVTAGPQDIDQAFKDGLVRRVSVQKLTGAKRTLQDPVARALVDLLLYDENTLGQLNPNPLADASALLTPGRWQTLNRWESLLQTQVRAAPDGRLDVALAHALAVAWYWSGVSVPRGPLVPPEATSGEPPLRTVWERAIACWSTVLAGDYLKRYVPSTHVDELRSRWLQQLRATIRASTAGEGSSSMAHGEARMLEDVLDSEERIARQMASITNGTMSFGPLMLDQLGELKAARQWIRQQRQTAPDHEVLRLLERALSPYAPILSRLENHKPEAALEAFKALSQSDRGAPEGRDVHADVLHELGRQQANIEHREEAMAAWQAALQAAASNRARVRIAETLEEFCRTRAAALQRTDHNAAIALLERGLAILEAAEAAESAEGVALTVKFRQSLELTLADILCQDAVTRLNGAIKAAHDTEPSADVITGATASQAALERAAHLGSPRATEQLPAARGAVGRMRWRLKKSRSIDFNTLSPAIRQRLVQCMAGTEAPKPVLKQLAGTVNAWIVLGIVVGLWWTFVLVSQSYGQYAGYQTAALIPWYVSATGLLSIGVVAIIRRKCLRAAFPFPRGRYIFPLDIIDARSQTIRVLPLRELVDSTAVHHHRYGAYTYTKLDLTFVGGVTETFSIRGKSQADALLKTLRECAQSADRFLATGGIEGLRPLDPLFDLHMGGGTPTSLPESDAPTVKPIPRALGRKAQWLTAATVASLVGPALWLSRDLLSDTAWWTTVTSTNTAISYRQYASTGWLHVAEARARLPRAVFAEASQRRTAGGFRAFLREFPDSDLAPQARAQVHLIIRNSWSTFLQHSHADRAMIDFTERMLAYLEAHDVATVQVRFQSPDVEALGAADRRLQEQSLQRPVAPIAEHFDRNRSGQRESAIVNRLASGFRAVFPGDVLNVMLGSPVATVPGVAAGRAPELLVQYAVRPSGALYSLESKSNGAIIPTLNTGRLYTGIVVSFEVVMRIPDDAQPIRFSLSVEPPSTFSVNGTTQLVASDQTVYDTMAERAFDQLSEKLKTAFFGVESSS